MKYKAIPMETKVDHKKRTIEGYASTFGNRDRVGDIVQKGAFKKTIAERFANGSKKDIKVLWQHFHPIGLPIHMEEDSKGLYTVSKIAKTPQGDEALILADEGVVDKMSIGYDIIKSEPKDRDQILQEIKLHEYSMVTFPANEEAGITTVTKGMGLGLSIGEIHRVLKEFGATDLNQLLKEGGNLSSEEQEKIEATIAALASSIDALEDLLLVGNDDDDDDEDDYEPQDDKAMDAELLQSIVKEFKI